MQKQEIEAYIDEFQKIRLAIADLTVSWGGLEDALARLLRQCLGLKASPELASAILFAPTSVDARVSIVDRVFQWYLRGLPEAERVLPLWLKLKSKIDSKKATRNEVAHGIIASVDRGNGMHVRLTPPLQDLHRFAKIKNTVHLPGLSAHDINQSAKTIRIIGGQVAEIGRLVHLAQLHKDEAYEEALATLEGALGPRLNKSGQTAEEDHSQPQEPPA